MFIFYTCSLFQISDSYEPSNLHISWPKKILFWLKQIGRNNSQETKLPVAYMTADCENLAKGN